MNGVINLLKPPGMTSSGAVVFLRRLLGEKKVGHTGTLDPGAAGVLPICVGRCTRLSDYMMDHEKEYLAEVAFGVGTDTLDSYGRVTARQECQVSREQLEAALPRFLGEIWQTPPAYSAVKIDGRKSYELARKGVAVQKPPRRVTVYAIAIEGQNGENRFFLRVRCSKGTYIRTLASDLGEALGVPAALAFLLRVRTGGFALGESVTIDEIKERAGRGDFSFVQSPEAALAELEEVREESPRARFALEHGQVVPWEGTPREGLFRVYSNGELFGVGKPCQGGYKLHIPLY